MMEMDSASPQPSRLGVESEQSPLTIGVRGRNVEFLMITEPEVQELKEGGTMNAVDLAFLGIAAGTAGNAILALISGAVTEAAMVAVWAVFGGSMVSSVYLSTRVYLARKANHRKIEQWKSGRLVQAPEEWLRRQGVSQ